MGDMDWMFLLFLLLVFVAFGCSDPQLSGAELMNVTVKPSAHSLEVSWEAPSYNRHALETYIVRVYSLPSTKGKGKTQCEYWISPLLEDPRKTIKGLEPGTSYKVQIYARYRQERNITDIRSDAVQESTLVFTEPEFLSQVWEQRVFVLVGAILMLFLLLFLASCVCCCYGKIKRKSLSLDRERDSRQTSKETNLPSATELQSRPKRNNQNRYSIVDVVQRLRTRRNPSYNSSANRSPATIRTLPRGGVSTNHGAANIHSRSPSPLRSSCPYQQAPDRPAAVLPPDGYESDPDADAYQNDVVLPPPRRTDMEVYSNEACFYGNIR